jgi:two-component system nitrogen regulation response regulator GlnG
VTFKWILSKHRAVVPGYRVLLIEDNPLKLQYLEGDLRHMGHQVQSSPRGEDAFRMTSLLDPEVVITDIVMPDIDMLEVMPELHRIRPGIKVIALSGNPYLLTLAATHGADRVLSKPFDGRALDVLIRSAMQ